LLEAERGAVDLLLTDVVMPGMSGTELAEVAAGRQPGLRVLLMSGYSKDFPEGMAPSGAPVLPKPFTPDALLRRVAELLGSPAPVSIRFGSRG
ncbi:MAG TPA: response regulator, partial [Anaeromyxobacteraceae bacterium]|nr:response regulator [Anaeromyxobacteraceae bacterium]